jgi:hypothetical protein
MWVLGKVTGWGSRKGMTARRKADGKRCMVDWRWSFDGKGEVPAVHACMSLSSTTTYVQLQDMRSTSHSIFLVRRVSNYAQVLYHPVHDDGNLLQLPPEAH